MRIDRRGNPGYRKIPAAGELAGNVDLTGNRQPEPLHAERIGDNGENQDGSFPSTPSDAFSELECTDSGFLKNVTSIFTAVGRALKDIKQGDSRTFD
ncbi:MAG: hypothetical protein IMF05_04455 [Proteobacteria bacterium]|nr:hypothetical protein [Pseudomonadota bacterium]